MNRPHVTLKLATSLDGRIATASGESRWITGPQARAEAHRLRAESDAVLVGIGTVLTDDPELTARTEPPAQRQPLRVILDHSLRIPPTSRLVATREAGPILVLSTGKWAPDGPAALARAGMGFGLCEPEEGEGEAAAALRFLSEHHDINWLLVEGGSAVAASFIRERLVDRLEWVRAPILLGEEGRPAIGALELALLADAPAFKRVAVREVGPDLWESYERV
jgi:diaminohydroxyphosphoribosylaminopyrimidine deaminase / 5-amino-6-(5-phosphoribosylamino)uracil reductase